MRRKLVWTWSTTGLAAALAVALGTAGGAAPASAASQNKQVTLIGDAQLPTVTTELCAAKKVLTQGGYSATIQYASALSPTSQIPIVSAVINTHPAGIVLLPASATALMPPVKQAVGAGIKVVTVDTALKGYAGQSSSIAADNVSAGKKAADLIGRALRGRTGEVALIGYTPSGGAFPSDWRQQGFEKEIKKFHNLKYIGAQVATDLPSAAAATNALLAAHPKLLAILGNWTDASEGAVQALRQHGATKKVMLVANDPDALIMNDIAKGYIRAAVVPQVAMEGTQAGIQMLRALAGKKTTRTITLPPVTVTQRNIRTPAIKGLYLLSSKACPA